MNSDINKSVEEILLYKGALIKNRDIWTFSHEAQKTGEKYAKNHCRFRIQKMNKISSPVLNLSCNMTLNVKFPAKYSFEIVYGCG